MFDGYKRVSNDTSGNYQSNFKCKYSNGFDSKIIKRNEITDLCNRNELDTLILLSLKTELESLST